MGMKCSLGRRWVVMASALVVVVMLAGPVTAGSRSVNKCRRARSVSSWSEQDRNLLCGQETQESGPEKVKCYEHARAWLTHRQALQVCSGSEDANAVQRCLSKIVTKFDGDGDAAVHLCSLATSDYPHLCAQHIKQEMGHRLKPLEVATMCQEHKLKRGTGSPGAGAIKCLRRAINELSLGERQAVQLCSKADSILPFKCAALAKTNRLLSIDHIIELCAPPHRTSVLAAECATKCPTTKQRNSYELEADACVAVCSKAKHPDSGECVSSLFRPKVLQKIFGSHSKESALTLLAPITQLCASAGTAKEHPVNCVLKIDLRSGSKLSAQQRVDACAGIKAKESIMTRAKCIRQGPQKLNLETRIKLCNGTAIMDEVEEEDGNAWDNMLGPAQCAKAVTGSSRLSIDAPQIVQLCKAAGSHSRAEEDGKTRAACILKFGALFTSTNVKPGAGALQQTAIRLCQSHHRHIRKDLSQMTGCLIDVIKVAGKEFAKPQEQRDVDVTEEAIDSMVDLCMGATDNTAGDCFRKMVDSLKVDVRQSARVCRASESRRLEEGVPTAVAAAICCVESLKDLTSRDGLFQAISSLGQHGVQKLCENSTTEACSAQGHCLQAASRRLPHFQPSMEDKMSLCANAASSYPVHCASAVSKMFPQLEAAQVVQLCGRSTGNDGIPRADPMRCFAAAKSMLSANALGPVTLDFFLNMCAGSTVGPESALCVKSYQRLAASVHTDDLSALSALCQTSWNATETMECIRSMPPALDRFKELLCTHSHVHALNGSTLQGSVDCASVLVKSISNNAAFAVAAVCQGAHDTGPALCAAELQKSAFSYLSAESVIALCKHARRETFAAIPACLTSMMDAGMSNSASFKLCSTANAPLVAAECAKHALQRTWFPEDDDKTAGRASLEAVLALCANATAQDPGICAKTAPAEFSPAQVTRLCSGLGEDHALLPLQCVSATTGQLNWADLDAVALLCGQPLDPASSARCAAQATQSQVALTEEQSARLCRSLNSSTALAHYQAQPTSCVDRLDYSALGLDDRIELCQGRSPFLAHEPEICAEKLAVHFPREEMSMLVSMCGSKASVGAWQCYEQAPFRWKPREKANLCHGAKGVSPAICAATIGSSSKLTNLDIVRVCKGAENDAPQRCVLGLELVLRGILDADTIVKLCANVRHGAPYKCLAFTMAEKLGHNALRLRPADLDACRDARSTPSKLSIKDSAALENTIFGRRDLVSDTELGPITILVSDQFGFYMDWGTLRSEAGHQKGPLGSASVSLHFEEGQDTYNFGSLGGNQSAVFGPGENAAPGDLVEAVFDSVVLDKVWGSMDLVFRFQGSWPVQSSKLRLSVQRNLDTLFQELFSCKTGALRLQCMPGQEELDEHFYLLPVPWSIVARSSTCRKLLEAMGLDIVADLAHSLASATLVHMLPGPAKLLSRIDVPDENMSPAEVLKVSENATRGEIQHAYHKASLEWHPDRWTTSHPALQKRASHIFSIVVSAKDQLVAAAAAKQQDMCSE